MENGGASRKVLQVHCRKRVFVLQVWRMAETKSRSVRVEDGLWGRFCAISGTQNEVFRKLLDGEVHAEPDLAQKTWERVGRIENMVEELLELGVMASTSSQAPLRYSEPGNPDPGTISGVTRGPADAPKNATCLHCGGKFAGPKWSTLCTACTGNGHRGDVRTCPECWQPS